MIERFMHDTDDLAVFDIISYLLEAGAPTEWTFWGM